MELTPPYKQARPDEARLWDLRSSFVAANTCVISNKDEKQSASALNGATCGHRERTFSKKVSIFELFELSFLSLPKSLQKVWGKNHPYALH